MPVSTRPDCLPGTWCSVASWPEPTSPWAVRSPRCAARTLRYGRCKSSGSVPGGFRGFKSGFTQLILGATFPVGLIIIVLTGAELFTGDAMLAPMAAFIHKISWAAVVKLWVWVYIGNLIGSIWYAYLMAYGPFASWDATGAVTVTAFGSRAIAIAVAKTSYVGAAGMWSAFLKAIGCNWLVNLAILLGICADDLVGKFFGVWFPIMAFVSSGFEHSVANMYFIPAGLFARDFITDPTKVTAYPNWTTIVDE